MKFISREDQLGQNQKSTLGDIFSGKTPELSDAMLDGEAIENKPTAKNWIDENKVHQAKFLSGSIESSRMFVGKQVIAVRDELRRTTHICFIESKALVACSIKNNEIIHREILHEGFTQRASICLDKFTGKPYVLHCSDSKGKRRLFLNDVEIDTSAEEPDFPFIAISQPPIGHFATREFDYGVLSYKCRKSGKIFVREFNQELVGPQQELNCPETIGGVDFALADNRIIFRIEALNSGRLQQMTAISGSRVKEIATFKALDFSALEPDALIPSNAPVFTDYLGNFQIPVTAIKDGNTMVLNITPNEQIVEAIRVRGEAFFTSAERFPKKPTPISALGQGNGITDGLGIIVTVQSEGALLSSNSQTGGHSFPAETMLNFEMPKTFAFKVTNCYTKGEKPNVVSMDYLFIEADELGVPVSRRLLFETWDMPLPIPMLQAKTGANKISLHIASDGWFEPGKTTIWLSDPKIVIKNIRHIDGRTIEIETDGNDGLGNEISFEMKNLLYYHRGTAIVE